MIRQLAPGNSLCRSPASASSFVWSLLTSTTGTPRSTRPRANALPRPCVQPVTSAAPLTHLPSRLSRWARGLLKKRGVQPFKATAMRAPQYKSASKPTPPSVEPATPRSAATTAVTRSGRATKILARFRSRVVCVLLLGILWLGSRACVQSLGARRDQFPRLQRSLRAGLLPRVTPSQSFRSVRASVAFKSQLLSFGCRAAQRLGATCGREQIR